MTFCDTTAGIGASFGTDARRTVEDGRKDRRGGQNSYLDKDGKILLTADNR